MYMLPVEVFVTGIKMESSNQHLEADQEIKMNSEWLISTDQHISSDIEETWQCFILIKKSFWKGTIKWSRVIFTDQGWFSLIKILDPGHKHF